MSGEKAGRLSWRNKSFYSEKSVISMDALFIPSAVCEMQSRAVTVRTPLEIEKASDGSCYLRTESEASFFIYLLAALTFTDRQHVSNTTTAST